MEVTNPAYGHLALSRVLGCGDIDFICSPVSYINTRAPGIDWANMSVIDSIKLHGKLYFAECDIRTHLTKSLAESRANSCEPGTYTGGVWQGPKSPELSRWLIQNSFARQLTHGCGLWWFDMWGGWYKDDLIMQDMGEYMKIAAIALADNKRESIAEAAVFVDETAYKYLNPNSPLASRCCSENRLPLGLAGAPYDIYDIADFETSISKYKAVIFLAPVKTEAIDSAINTCRMKNIGMLVAGRENPTLEAEQIREFYVENSIHIFCETNDVVNVCENYISIHAGSAGEKILLLGKTRKITPLLKTGNEIYYSDKIVVTLQEFETRLYRLD